MHSCFIPPSYFTYTCIMDCFKIIIHKNFKEVISFGNCCSFVNWCCLRLVIRSKGIGTYDTVEECLEKYNIKKLEYLRNLVDEYGTLLSNDVREVLLAWTPDKLISAT